MQQGAYDYIEKPLNADKLNRLKALIPKALEKFDVQQKNRELTSRLEGLTHYGELTGQSEAMRGVYQIIDAVAPSTASVLILGESGTGKELVARAMHTKSERSKGPFFALNCAALPKEILENELFGHEKGAFTGSTNEKPGAFEMASGGTIFLDEVAEMSPDIQVKLLRALETRQVRRLGGKKEISVDIRIVAATNKDLQKAIADGRAARGSVLPVGGRRDRRCRRCASASDDIQLLATDSSRDYASRTASRSPISTTPAWDWILSYHWPGNVRELKNAVERAVIMARGDTISAERRHAAASAGGRRGADVGDDSRRRHRYRGAAPARAADLRVDLRRHREDSQAAGHRRRRKCAATCMAFLIRWPVRSDGERDDGTGRTGSIAPARPVAGARPGRGEEAATQEALTPEDANMSRL